MSRGHGRESMGHRYANEETRDESTVLCVCVCVCVCVCARARMSVFFSNGTVSLSQGLPSTSKRVNRSSFH